MTYRIYDNGIYRDATTEEIEEKTKQGKTNKIKIKANESILKIIGQNIFTYFN